MKKEIVVLPNPEIVREAINPNCSGCNRVFEGYATPEGTILVDVCTAYEKPDTKWRHYRVESEMKTIKGKEEEVFYHYNPCPLASHMEHSPKPEELRGKIINPLKASKRRSR